MITITPGSQRDLDQLMETYCFLLGSYELCKRTDSEFPLILRNFIYQSEGILKSFDDNFEDTKQKIIEYTESIFQNTDVVNSSKAFMKNYTKK